MKSSHPDPERILARALARCPPAVADLARQSRILIRSQLATATEEVRVADECIQLGFCVSDYAVDGVVALEISASGVTLFFRRLGPLAGTEELLLPAKDGRGRIMRIDEAVIHSPLTMKAVIRAAAIQANPRLRRHGLGRTLVKQD